MENATHWINNVANLTEETIDEIEEVEITLNIKTGKAVIIVLNADKTQTIVNYTIPNLDEIKPMKMEAPAADLVKGTFAHVKRMDLETDTATEALEETPQEEAPKEEKVTKEEAVVEESTVVTPVQQKA